MDNQDRIKAQVISDGILPLFYHDDKVVCKGIAHALYEGGVRMIEFTNRGKNALANFKALVQERDTHLPGLKLGIGTIKNETDAHAFIDAGADLLISPSFDSSVSDVAYMNKVLWIPGCMTPTEIQQAENAGWNLIKLFPGNLLGPSFIQAIKPLFPAVQFVVTGGVDTTKENISGWFKAGAAGVGLGSKLITEELMNSGDYTTLTSRARDVISIIQSLKN